MRKAIRTIAVFGVVQFVAYGIFLLVIGSLLSDEGFEIGSMTFSDGLKTIGTILVVVAIPTVLLLGCAVLAFVATSNKRRKRSTRLLGALLVLIGVSFTIITGSLLGELVFASGVLCFFYKSEKQMKVETEEQVSAINVNNG